MELTTAPAPKSPTPSPEANPSTQPKLLLALTTICTVVSAFAVGGQVYVGYRQAEISERQLALAERVARTSLSLRLDAPVEFDIDGELKLEAKVSNYGGAPASYALDFFGSTGLHFRTDAAEAFTPTPKVDGILAANSPELSRTVVAMIVKSASLVDPQIVVQLKERTQDGSKLIQAPWRICFRLDASSRKARRLQNCG